MIGIDLTVGENRFHFGSNTVFVLFRFVSFRFVSFCLVSFPFASVRFVSFRFVSFCLTKFTFYLQLLFSNSVNDAISMLGIPPENSSEEAEVIFYCTLFVVDRYFDVDRLTLIKRPSTGLALFFPLLSFLGENFSVRNLY